MYEAIDERLSGYCKIKFSYWSCFNHHQPMVLRASLTLLPAMGVCKMGRAEQFNELYRRALYRTHYCSDEESLLCSVRLFQWYLRACLNFDRKQGRLEFVEVRLSMFCILYSVERGFSKLFRDTRSSKCLWRRD